MLNNYIGAVIVYVYEKLIIFLVILFINFLWDELIIDYETLMDIPIICFFGNTLVWLNLFRYTHLK